MAFWNKKHQSKQTFSDIIRGMQYAVNTAQEILEQHHIQLLNKYFDNNGIPITKQIKISNDKILDVPLISVINQNSLSIDEMEIEFNVRINSVELKELEDEKNNIERSSFTVDFTPNENSDNKVLVKIKFKTKEKPEGVSRIVDEFDKKIYPIDN